MNSRVIALSVKSLEQQTKSVSLPYNSTVLELKQKIKVVFDIDGDRQRLLFRGKVLRDDKKLLDYDNLDDGKVIHLIVRPLNNQDARSRLQNGRIRASTREISDDYAVITVDATLDSLEDARMLMQNIANNMTPGNPPSIWEQRRQVSLSHNVNRTLRANANRTGSIFGRSPSQRTIDSLFMDYLTDNIWEDERTLPPISLPVPSSLEMSLSSLLAFMSDIRAMIDTPPPGPYRRRNSSFGRILRESRQRLRDVGERQANQVGLVMDEVADLMTALVPQLRHVADSLGSNSTDSSEEQLGNVLRIANMVQFLSSTFHFLGSILSTAEPEVIHSPSPPPRSNTINASPATRAPVTNSTQRTAAPSPSLSFPTCQTNNNQSSAGSSSSNNASSSTSQQSKRKHSSDGQSSSSGKKRRE